MKRITLLLAISIVFMASTNPYESKKIHDNSHKTIYPKAVFKVGERLDYKMSYGFVNAGVASLEVKKADFSHDGKELLHIEGRGRSTGTFDWFFKVRDEFDSYVYTDVIRPYQFDMKIEEGSYSKKRHFQFYQNEGLLDNGKHDTLVPIPANTQDMLSAFYYGRTLDLSNLKEGDIISILSYVDFEYFPVIARYRGIQNVKIGLGTFECMKFTPVVQTGRVFKSEEDLAVYISNDANRIPVLAEAKLMVGSVRMELTSFKNLSGALAMK